MFLRYDRLPGYQVWVSFEVSKRVDGCDQDVILPLEPGPFIAILL
jgi:hypothetical protein